MRSEKKVAILMLIVICAFLTVVFTNTIKNNSVSKTQDTGQPVPLVFDVLETSNQVRVWKINVDGVYYLLASNNHGGVTLIPFDE